MNQRLDLQAIRASMEREGFNSSAIAKALGVSREAVSKWLKGVSVPRPDKLLKLALLLKLRLNQIVVPNGGPLEPVVAFRKRGASKITQTHIQHAKQIGHLLKPLVPYLPFDQFIRPATLKDPQVHYQYLQRLVTEIRNDLGVTDTGVIDFYHLIKRFKELQAVLIPVLWGSKDKHENALHIFLPDTKTTWVYLNLDVEVHDFKFWMAHELGHVLATDLRGDIAEDFADAFAGSLLFPEILAIEAYQRVCSAKTAGAQINRIKEIAEHNLISPITVYHEMNRFAEQSCQRRIDLEPSIYGAARNLSNNYFKISESLLGEDSPSAEDYVKMAETLFETSFFIALRSYLREAAKGPGYVQTILELPLLDAREVYLALT